MGEYNTAKNNAMVGAGRSKELREGVCASVKWTTGSHARDHALSHKPKSLFDDTEYEYERMLDKQK